MTRNKKNTLALFEVLRDGKDKGKSGSVLQTPKWWKRGPVAPHTPAMPTTPGGLTIGAAASQATASRQGVWFRLTSGHLVLATGVLVLLVGAAYWAGKSPRTPELTRATDVIKKDTPSPAVLDVGHDTGGAAEQDLSAVGQGRTPAADVGGAGSTRVVAQDGTRVAGRNYIVVQSYPDISTANEAREYLAKSGIACTVEKGLSFAPRWYCVVTTAGFEKVSSREYEDYTRKIQSASNRFVSPKFKKFEPQAYRWR